MEKLRFDRFPCITVAEYFSYFGSVIYWVENHSQTMIRYLKRLLNPQRFVRVEAFPMYGGIGVSAPSLHRESTDSLICDINYDYIIESCFVQVLWCKHSGRECLVE